MNKKNLLLSISLVIFVAAGAQYKKASFLNKTGRIYDIGATMRVLGNERSSAFGFFLSYGKEGEKRIHHWYDTEVVLGSDFRYTTVSSYNANTPVVVSGKTGSDISIRYNWGYFLTDQSDAETKFAPFVNLALGYTGSWGYGTVSFSPDEYPEKNVETQTSAFVYGGGAGIVYRFSDLVGIRLSAAYYGILDGKPSSTVFPKLVNHPAVNFALRFKMNRGD